MISEPLREWVARGTREASPDVHRLAINVPGVLRWLGYTPGGLTASAHVREIAERLLGRSNLLLVPSWAWRPVLVRFDHADEALRCEGDARASLAVGKIVLSQIAPAEAVAAFVITIGPRLENESRRLFSKGDALEGFVLDAIGSLAVEACGDLLEKTLEAELTPLNWRISNRFSPGYCTWATSDQAALFALLPSTPAGVALGDSSLMTPIKSISGIVGLGKDVKHRPYMCDICTMEHCRQRLVAARPA